MSNSSAPPDYLTTLNDVITIDVSDMPSLTTSSIDAITLTSGGLGGAGSSYYYNTGAGTGGFSNDTITISGGGSGYTIGGLTSITAQDITFNWNLNEEFVNCLPDLDRVKKMCETYPGLKIAYEKFVTTYKLVRDDYDTPEDQRPKP
jgi:hypothetical protein